MWRWSQWWEDWHGWSPSLISSWPVINPLGFTKHFVRGLLTISPSLLKSSKYLTLKSKDFSRKAWSARWARYKDLMLVHTLLYLNLREVLTSKDLSWTLRCSINMHTTYKSTLKKSKMTGNGSRTILCVCDCIWRMPFPMSLWDLVSRNSWDLHGKRNYMNGKFYHLVWNSFQEYWRLLLNPFFVSFIAKALVW